MIDNITKNQIVLIIKDREKDLSQLLNTLQSAKYAVLAVQNKQDYIFLIKSTQPSFILVDILMSDMDGWQISQEIKNNSATNHIPLALINSSGDIARKVALSNWYNVDCVAKSSEPKKIAYLITNRLLAKDGHSEQLSIAPIDRTSRDPNQDLDNFASLVSHDLQAPLRSLTMFAELLADEYQDDLDTKAQEYLKRISNNSSRMQTLIEDLQAYSRAGKSDQTWVMVDLNHAWQQVEENLQYAIATAEAKIVVGDLPQVLINPTEISQVLQNLLENAIKFSSEQSPYIEVNATKRAKEWLISIKDNGIGIKAEFQSQIFQAFGRLHSSEAYPGAGIGLATCQKIVERYGGQIGVESVEKKGSTFYFTLPMNMCPSPTVANISRS